ncbi:GntR family transcriptional regulator [Variovorax sp. Sphag1AA]|uniref:GntR family transcriptional regulator n=1 Tax=Variovorax sp. Sphag1AA TaxID=2587027 RepID=UPI00161BB07C|nr:GntR family transcriptional regulator [Variovorax sp. Sphag1AA]MBB3180920.1 DNA-binding GntR family transcriptional regulator [Variovorax sp. Sphag1AA]
MPTSTKSSPPSPTRAKAPARPRGRAAPKLLRAPGEPLWRQLVQSLRSDILKGVYRVGSQLPTEEELCERFSVSRHTVREALRQLRIDGLVSSRQGSGTTVMPPPPSSPFNVHRVASIDELIAYAAESRYVVERTDVIASDELAEDELPLPANCRWLRIQGFRFNDEPASPPICWTEVFVASEYAGVERLMNRQRGPIWQLIEDMYGERLVEVEQTIRVRTVPADVADGLRAEPGASVVEVRRTYRTTSDKVAEVSVNLYPADQFRFSMKLRRA